MESFPEAYENNHPLAAADCNTRLIDQLLASSTDVNARGYDDQTPLHEAAGMGHRERVELLIASGEDVNAKKRGFTPLYGAAFNGHLGMVELLISKGADVNAKGNDGETPLHLAAAVKGNISVVELLISKGADINAKDKVGLTPVSVAKEKGFQDIVDLLQSHGAKE